MKKKLYILSGLGADKRVFQYLKFDSGVEVVFIDWIEPIKNESLKDYAFRISKFIDDSETFILLGLSFGGIVACEVTEFVKPQKTILVSSIASNNELPWYYLVTGKLKLNYLFPKTTKGNFILNRLFSIKTARDKQLLNDVLAAASLTFTKWAIHQILNLKRKVAPSNLVRIHGSKDRLLPLKVRAQHLIHGGGHFMIVDRAEEISKILNLEIC